MHFMGADLFAQCFLSLLSVVLCVAHAAGQPQYVRKNEHAIISFFTTNQKRVVVAVDNNDKYIVYRYGTKQHIELQYPAPDSNSWKKMQYYWYLRPSMGKNDGYDIYSLSFVADTFRYVVVQSNAGDEGGESLYVQVLNLKGSILATFPANRQTCKGHLMDLRDYEEILSKGMEEYHDPNLN